MCEWSVVIPTLNEEKTIGILLNDLCNQTIPPSDIIIVDAGSKDATKKIVEKYILKVKNSEFKKSKGTVLIRYIQSKPPVGGQRTVGGKLAQYENICFFDADVCLKNTFFEELSRLKRTLGVVTACPKYIPFSKCAENSADQVTSKPIKSSFYIRIVYAVFNALFKIGQDRYPSGAGSCIITTKSVAQKVGWFKSEYLSDDIAYIRQAAPHGFRMLPIPVYVSDRRWKKYGFWQTLYTYVKMSRAFMKNDFLSQKEYVYEFGKYESEKI